jgi:hypothetical protein
MRSKIKLNRPRREQLHNMSRSAVKTQLKLWGFKVPRDLFGYGCGIFSRGNRLYRLRWSAECVLLDESCTKPEFDRWANSTERTFTWSSFCYLVVNKNTLYGKSPHMLVVDDYE